MNRVWILNHHANTNGHRHYELAREFASHGIEVTVFCSSFYHHRNAGYRFNEDHVEEVSNKVRFVWLKTVPSYPSNGIRRMLNMVDYFRKIIKFAPGYWKQNGKPDAVIGSSVHPFAWEAAYWVSRKTGAKFIAEVRDFWPVSLIESSRMPALHPATILFKLIEDRSYKHADAYVSTFKNGHKRICDEKGFPRERYEWIPNGISIESVDTALESTELKLPKDLDCFLENHWCFVYAGSVAINEGIQFMVDAFQIAKGKGCDVYLAVIGEGNYKKELLSVLEVRKIDYIKCFNKISRQQVALALRKGKACLAVWCNESVARYGNSMNKLIDYMYSGKPTVFVCAGDNAIADANAGVLSAMDINEYADAICRLYEMQHDEIKQLGENGVQAVREIYDYRIIAENI